jgi:hypothetical protein
VAGESKAKALLLMGCTASAALCVSLQRDANAMHFALEPASSARLGFVFFMQLPAREMKHFYLDSQSEKKKKKRSRRRRPEKSFSCMRLAASIALFHTHANEAEEEFFRLLHCDCGNLFDLP